MANKTLEQLYAEHSGKISDKWSIYLTEYDRIFAEYRDRSIRLLEIGIQNGGSLEIWSKYFMNAQKLVGCDINADCAHLAYEDQRIAVVVGDANNDLTYATVLGHSSAFDIVIDDGSHYSSDIVKSFAKYFPHIAEGGVFVAEDLHCSYWQEFEGGLFNPFSSMAFFKRLADIANHEHWGVEKHRASILSTFFSKYEFQIDEEILRHIHSVEFVNSLCIVRKSRPQHNQLGKRFIAGSFEEVVQGVKELHSTVSMAPNQGPNGWAERALAPEEELPLRINELTGCKVELAECKAELAECRAELTECRAELVHLKQVVTAMKTSTSWRFSKPIRIAGRQLKRIKRIIQLIPLVICHGGGLRNTIWKARGAYQREGIAGIKRGLLIAQTAGQIKTAHRSDGFDRNDYAEWIRRYDMITAEERAIMYAKMQTWQHKPLISVVMPTCNSKSEWLVEAIESVRSQIYPSWELCIADDASTSNEVHRIIAQYTEKDARIKAVYRKSNGHISAASNSAVEIATGDWIALLDHDDLLAEHALFWVANAINQTPDIRMIYSDEDKIDDKGLRFDPYFKCDWNKDLFYSQNMFNHLGVYSASLIRQVGGFRVGFEGSQDYDLILRCIESIKENQICHIPRVLYHWRVHSESVAKSVNAKPYAVTAAERALNEHFVRRGVASTAKFEKIGYRINYELPTNPPLVTLIIPTRNGLQLIRQCINSVLEKTSYSNYEILIVDNGSDDRKTLDYFESLKSNPRVRILRDDRPFNYSALNNVAVKAARGELVALINNDIEVISTNWLSEMVSHALREEIGAVGARLWYPNDTLQHGGVVLGIGGVAGHSHKHLGRGHNGYFGRAALTQRFSAVTGACLLIRKDIYEKVGGLNEADLQVAFNDVDFCLRVREAGYHNLWTPYAELYHHESASRGHEDTPEKQARFSLEIAYMQRRWGAQLLNDPAYSPNLAFDREDFSLGWPPRIELVSDNGANGAQASFTEGSRACKAPPMVNRTDFGP